MAMKTGADRSIEGLKLFPAFAWGIVILFAGFVYTLTLELRSVADTLETTASINAAIVDSITPPVTPPTGTKPGAPKPAAQ